MRHLPFFLAFLLLAWISPPIGDAAWAQPRIVGQQPVLTPPVVPSAPVRSPAVMPRRPPVVVPPVVPPSAPVSQPMSSARPGSDSLPADQLQPGALQPGAFTLYDDEQAVFTGNAETSPESVMNRIRDLEGGPATDKERTAIRLPDKRQVPGSNEMVERTDRQNPKETALQRGVGNDIDRDANRGDRVRERMGLENARDLLTPIGSIPGAGGKGVIGPGESGQEDRGVLLTPIGGIPGSGGKRVTGQEGGTVLDEVGLQKREATGNKGKYDLETLGDRPGPSREKGVSDHDPEERYETLTDFSGGPNIFDDPRKSKPDASTAGASSGGDPRLGKKDKSTTQKIGAAIKAAAGWAADKIGMKSSDKAASAAVGVRGTPKPDGVDIDRTPLTDTEKLEKTRKIQQGLINPGGPDSNVGATTPDSVRALPEKGLGDQLDPLILTDDQFGAGPGRTSSASVPVRENTLVDPPDLDSGVKTSAPPQPDPGNPTGVGDGGSGGGGGGTTGSH